MVSEASSAAKIVFESPMFTKAAVDRVISRAGVDVDFNKKKIGVIGLGSIGSSLVANLIRRGCEVYTFDVVERSSVDFPSTKVRACSTFQEMLETCDYIFGCTGRDIFQNLELPIKHKDGLILASVSSGDMEFLSLINYIKNEKHRHTSKKDVIFKSSSGTITILQNGYPINFDGTQGSADPKYTQLKTSMLLVGLIQAYLLQDHSEYQKNRHNIIMHSPEAQRYLLSEWFKIVPEMKENYSEDLIANSKDIEWLYDNSTGVVVEDDRVARMFL